MKPAKKKPAKKASKSKSGGAAPPKKKSSSKAGARIPTATKPVQVKTKESVNGTLKNIKTENRRLTRQLELKNRELEIEAALERVRPDDGHAT